MQNSTYGTDIGLLKYVYGSSILFEIIASPHSLEFQLPDYH